MRRWVWALLAAIGVLAGCSRNSGEELFETLGEEQRLKELSLQELLAEVRPRPTAEREAILLDAYERLHVDGGGLRGADVLQIPARFEVLSWVASRWAWPEMAVLLLESAQIHHAAAAGAIGERGRYPELMTRWTSSWREMLERSELAAQAQAGATAPAGLALVGNALNAKIQASARGLYAADALVKAPLEHRLDLEAALRATDEVYRLTTQFEQLNAESRRNALLAASVLLSEKMAVLPEVSPPLSMGDTYYAWAVVLTRLGTEARRQGLNALAACYEMEATAFFLATEGGEPQRQDCRSDALEKDGVAVPEGTVGAPGEPEPLANAYATAILMQALDFVRLGRNLAEP